MFRRSVALLLTAALAACSGLPMRVVAPQVSVAEVAVKHLGLLEQRFDVGLRVGNPNNFDLTVEALEFELELNGRPFAEGRSGGAAHLTANASTLVRIDAMTHSQNLVEAIRTLSPALLQEGVPYRLRGRVKVGGWSRWLPFDHAGVYRAGAKVPDAQAG